MFVPSPNYPARLPQNEMEQSSEDIPSGEYTYLPIERVRFGPESSRHLSEELDRLGCKKPFLITGRTIFGKTKLVPQVIEYSGRKLVGIFHEILQHAPLGPIKKASQEVREAGADALISLGGGSPIDSTKILVKELSGDFSKPALPHIAIPTTLSAAEFSHTAGLSDGCLDVLRRTDQCRDRIESCHWASYRSKIRHSTRHHFMHHSCRSYENDCQQDTRTSHPCCTS